MLVCIWCLYSTQKSLEFNSQPPQCCSALALTTVLSCLTSQWIFFVALSHVVASVVLRLIHAAVPGRADQDAAHSVPTCCWIRQRYAGVSLVFFAECCELDSPLLHLLRVPLSLGVQQPDATRVSYQPGDVVLRQQPIAGLHLQPAAHLCQSRSGW